MSLKSAFQKSFDRILVFRSKREMDAAPPAQWAALWLLCSGWLRAEPPPWVSRGDDAADEELEYDFERSQIAVGAALRLALPLIKQHVDPEPFLRIVKALRDFGEVPGCEAPTLADWLAADALALRVFPPMQAAAKQAGEAPGLNGATPTPKDARPVLALMLLQEHPDWSDRRIAKKAGYSDHTTIVRDDTYRRARALTRGDRASLPRGSRTADGDVEAWDHAEVD